MRGLVWPAVGAVAFLLAGVALLLVTNTDVRLSQAVSFCGSAAVALAILSLRSDK